MDTTQQTITTVTIALNIETRAVPTNFFERLFTKLSRNTVQNVETITLKNVTDAQLNRLKLNFTKLTNIKT